MSAQKSQILFMSKQRARIGLSDQGFAFSQADQVIDIAYPWLKLPSSFSSLSTWQWDFSLQELTFSQTPSSSQLKAGSTRGLICCILRVLLPYNSIQQSKYMLTKNSAVMAAGTLLTQLSHFADFCLWQPRWSRSTDPLSIKR